MAPSKRSLILMLAVSMLLSACAQKAATPDPAFLASITPPAIVVDITDDSCPSLEAQPGMTVGWINRGKKEHVVMSEMREDGSRRINSGVIQPGGAFAITIIEPETISYVCSEDGSLKGTIVVPAPTPFLVPTGLGSGVAHSCLLTQQGQVSCWGQGAHLGEDIPPEQFGKPFPVEGLHAISLGVGWYHSCAAARDGLVQCWGQNTYGQLGDGSLQDSASPVDVIDLSDVTAVSSGATHSCALTESGEVYCWGQNTSGQLGDETRTDRPSPVLVKGLTGPASSIEAGSTYSCALLLSEKVECWGEFNFIPIEESDLIRTSPVSIPNIDGDVAKISAGDYHLCILTKSGEVLCEGNLFPPDDSPFSKPVEVLDELQGHIRDLLAETDFTCVLTDSGEVHCWGDNSFGQLGDGTFNPSAEPKRVSIAGNDVIALGGGHYTACALTSQGGVTCWGDTSFGQLGDGTARWK